MNDEALHFSSREEVSQDADARGASTLGLFVCAVLARPQAELGPAQVSLVLWARAEAARASAAGRIAVGGEQVLTLRLLYEALRPEAAGIRPTSGPPPGGARWERVLAALGSLRHRQRAALAARYLAGLSEAEAGAVIGLRPSQARAVVEAGIASIARVLGEPVDVRRSLRMGAARALRKPAPPSGTVSVPSRMPRAVVRALLAPPPREVVSAALPEGAGTPKQQAPAEPSGSAPPLKDGRRPRAKTRRLPKAPRVVIAIAFAALVAAVFVPAPARNRSSGPTRDGPAHAARPASTVLGSHAPASARAAAVSPSVTVRAGDSLWKIAGRGLGDPYRWPEIWRANRGRAMTTGERFTDPNLIRPAWVLFLPPR
jgi:nucleoid-associated protein YgaU